MLKFLVEMSKKKNPEQTEGRGGYVAEKKKIKKIKRGNEGFINQLV